MTEINPDIVATIDQQEVAKEVFGALGYKDADRFLLEEQAPMVQEMAGRLEQLEQALQQLTDQGAGKQIDAQARLMAAQIKGQSDIQAAKEKAMGEVMSTQIRADSTARMDAMRRQLSLIATRIKAEKNQIARGELLLQKEALVHQMMLAEPEIGIDDEGNREAGSRQGVFRREGAIMNFYSLDDVSDGRLNYCETVINLRTDAVEMTFYPF